VTVLEVAFPYHLDDRGRTATVGYQQHVREMLELLLLTRAGERVNRPDFGCGVLDMVFGPSSPEVAAALNITITTAVTRWLGDVLTLTALDVTAQDGELQIALQYQLPAAGVTDQLTVTVPGAM
jgi:hypothetical protein